MLDIEYCFVYVSDIFLGRFIQELQFEMTSSLFVEKIFVEIFYTQLAFLSDQSLFCCGARLGRLYNWVFSIVRGSCSFTTRRAADMNTKHTAPVWWRQRTLSKGRKGGSFITINVIEIFFLPKTLVLIYIELQSKNSAEFKT